MIRNYCRNLIKKPWAFIRVPCMNPTILGVIGPGFLNQVPTLTASLVASFTTTFTKHSDEAVETMPKIP